MMKCSKCNQNIVGNKKVKDSDRYAWAATLSGLLTLGPIGTAAGVIVAGDRVYHKYIKDEITVKCPHCKEKLTLTKKEYKELKKEIKAVLDEERKSKQNRIKR